MKFKQYFKTISHNQIVQEKLELIKFFDKYGTKVTKYAYGVGRSTIYEWKRRYKISNYNPTSLIPKSKRPKHTRRSNIELLIKEFIKRLRMETYRLGKSKIKVLLYEYCTQNNLPNIFKSSVGKIIKKRKVFLFTKKVIL